ncbi:hypothetical protein [Streptomyces sp. SP17BM10]|uniref:hypothetical protein n=1 Tax=Streptomyces sp. SP17BM10 TaxID=3002530 RepID=UPI003FCC7ECC
MGRRRRLRPCHPQGQRPSDSRGHAAARSGVLHRSRRPLDEAPIDRVTAHEWSGRQVDIFDAIADAELESGEPDGCSPWVCRSGAPVAIERTVAWLNGFRRLHRRYEPKADHFAAFASIAAAVICYRRLSK